MCGMVARSGCGVGLATQRSWVRLPASRFQVTTLGCCLHVHMCLCHQAVQFGTGQRAVMPCGWEGNRRSGVALATRHRLKWIIHLPAHGLRKGDEHPAYTHHGGMAHLPLPTQFTSVHPTRKKLFCRVASRRRCELGIITQQFYNEVKKSYHDRAGLASGENAVT